MLSNLSHVEHDKDRNSPYQGGVLPGPPQGEHSIATIGAILNINVSLNERINDYQGKIWIQPYPTFNVYTGQRMYTSTCLYL